VEAPLNTEEAPLYTAKQVVLLSQNSSDTLRKSITMSNVLIIFQLRQIVTLCQKIGTFFRTNYQRPFLKLTWKPVVF